MLIIVNRIQFSYYSSFCFVYSACSVSRPLYNAGKRALLQTLIANTIYSLLQENSSIFSSIIYLLNISRHLFNIGSLLRMMTYNFCLVLVNI